MVYPEQVEELISYKGFKSSQFSFLRLELRSHPEIAELAILKQPRCIRYVPSETLLQYPNLLKIATIKDVSSFEFAPPPLVGNKGFLLDLIREMPPDDIGELMYSFPDEISQDVEINRLIVQKCRNEPGERIFQAITMIPQIVLWNPEFAKFALGECSCLICLNDHLRRDIELIKIAVTRDFTQFKLVPPFIRSDLADWAIGIHGSCYLVLGALQSNRSLLLSAIKTYPEAFRHAPPELQADREVAMAAALGDGNMLAYAAPALHSDPQILIVAVATAGHYWRVRNRIVPYPYFREHLDIFYRQLNTFMLVCLKRTAVDEERRRKVDLLPISKLNEHGRHFAGQFKARILKYWMGNFDQFIIAATRPPLIVPDPFGRMAALYWARPDLPFSL